MLQDADVRFYRRFLRSLVRQVRYLRHTAGDAHRGVARMQADHRAQLRRALHRRAGHATSNPTTERLSREIERQILPDGGHISRDPGAIIEVLLELLPLRQAFASRNIAPPQALLNAIDRMMPMLRFFRHSDGTFAHFNGMGATPAELLLTLLAYDETRGAPLSNAPYSAYQRLEAGGGVLIMDTGRAPPIEMSLEAHAGCLSFEFSSPRAKPHRRQLRHAGTAREEWRHLPRATRGAFDGDASTTTSSAQIRRDGRRSAGVLGGSPMLGGPSHVSVAREEQRPTAIVLRASAMTAMPTAYGIVHERTLDARRRRNAARGRGPVPCRRRRRRSCAPARTTMRCASICIPRSRRRG